MKNLKKQLIILALFLCSSSCSVFAKPMKIEYLMPEGFTGGVIVLYNQPDGVTPEISKDGTIRYRIPKDGFLKVNTADPEDVYNYSFYYVDGKNNLTDRIYSARRLFDVQVYKLEKRGHDYRR